VSHPSEVVVKSDGSIRFAGLSFAVQSNYEGCKFDPDLGQNV